ncbi:hypothetical protein B0J17DRAFT_110613 [Rhizoctonia solani]|nr:hypothetical protein B0J17DRAFT_110613 [Rhizoctonia solani]
MPQIFKIPEIIYLICEQARVADLARLLSTSRLFFECAMPFVWTYLPHSAPQILTNLLPDGAKCLEDNLDTTVAEDIQPLDAISLMRFNLYAPYVKKPFRPCEDTPLHRQWSRLSKLVGIDPILPNLEALGIAFYPTCSREIIRNPASYIASPTLVDISHFGSPKLFVAPEDLSNIVSNIA